MSDHLNQNHHLSIKHICRLLNQFVFQYDILHKDWRERHSSPVARLFCYSNDQQSQTKYLEQSKEIQ